MGQSFDDYMHAADSLYEAKEYEASGVAFDSAFALREGRASQYYNAACSWALVGQNAQALRYLKTAADKGWYNLEWMKRDEDLQGIQGLPGWRQILEQVQANLDEFEKDFNKPLKEQLELIYVRDQTLRQLLETVEETYGNNSPEMAYFWYLISKEDSLNEKEVVQIIEDNGWLGQSEVGGKANTALWLVIQHADVELQEKYLPLLKASVKKGESQGSHLALLEDRILMYQGKPQIYGSQIVLDQETGQWKLYDLENPDQVDERRKEVGLGPLKEYLDQMGVEWNKEK